MIVTIPINKIWNAFVDISFGGKPEVFLTSLDIGVCFLHITWLHRFKVDFGLLITRPLDQFNKAHQGLGRIVT